MSDRKLDREELILLSAIAATQIQPGQNFEASCMDLLNKYIKTYDIFKKYNQKIIDKNFEEEQRIIKEILERREKNNT